MNTCTKTLITLLCMSFPTVTMAQNTAPTTTETPQEAPAQNGTTEGTPAPATQTPTDVVYEVHGDWQVRCAAEDASNCFLYQLGQDDNGNPIAEFNLLPLKGQGEAVAGITIVTPLGTDLRNGLDWSVDSAEPRKYPFSWCVSIGCFVRFGVTDEQITSMKRGANGRVRLSAIQAPGVPVNVKISLSGFTAAYATLSEVVAQKEQ